MTSLGFENKFDKDISSIISEYLIEIPVKIKDYFLNNIDGKVSRNDIEINWGKICETSEKKYIDYLYDNFREEISWNMLSRNPNAIHLLKKHPEHINMSGMSFNTHPEATILIEQNINKMRQIDWICLSANANKNSICILKNNIDKISWVHLSKNPNALDILELYPGKIYWLFFLTIPANNRIVKLIEDNLDKINQDSRYILSKRSDTMHILEKNPELIDWLHLSSNEYAIDLLEKNLDKVNWEGLSMNKNAIRILEKYPENIVWSAILDNPNAIHIIEKNLNKINTDDLYILSRNPNAINFLENHPDIIDWVYLSRNPNAIHLLEKNIDKISWCDLFYNINAIDLQNKYIHKLNYYDKVDIIFENDENEYKMLLKSCTELVYNM